METRTYELRESLSSTLHKVREARKKALSTDDWTEHQLLCQQLVEINRKIRAVESNTCSEG